MAGSLNENQTTTSRPSPSQDRGVKILLLLSSMVTLGFLVAAMVRENFLSAWQQHQKQYKEMLLNSPDEKQRKLAESFHVEIRQIDLPQLKVTDRCVICHVGIDNPAMKEVPQPYRVHPGDYLEHHPVEKYGCTICHQGQGAATNFREAKAADTHWDYPLLPPRLTGASCGTCHSPESSLMAKHSPALAHGRQLFLDRGCLSCHKLKGTGGQLGPVLDNEGNKIKHQLPFAHVRGEHTLANWLTQHFDKPQAVVPGSKMRPPRLTQQENEALTIYMLSLKQRSLPQTYLPADRIAEWNEELHHKEMKPQVLYNRYCVNCHGDGTFAKWDKFYDRFLPAIRGPGLRSVADADYLRQAIHLGRPGTLMPGWGKDSGGLSDAQIERLITFLSTGDGRPAQELNPPPALTSGNSTRGKQLFDQLCIGCHGRGGLAPSLSNAVFQRTASDEFLALTIVNGRQDTPMPAFGKHGEAGKANGGDLGQKNATLTLTDEEIRDLVAFLRSMGSKRP